MLQYIHGGEPGRWFWMRNVFSSFTSAHSAVCLSQVCVLCESVLVCLPHHTSLFSVQCCSAPSSQGTLIRFHFPTDYWLNYVHYMDNVCGYFYFIGKGKSHITCLFLSGFVKRGIRSPRKSNSGEYENIPAHFSPLQLEKDMTCWEKSL